ncbi:unnamed protein product, partial [Rotaria magnacalcarata]
MTIQSYLIPMDFFMDTLGTVYVADAGNQRVIRWLKRTIFETMIISENGAGRQIPAYMIEDVDDDDVITSASRFPPYYHALSGHNHAYHGGDTSGAGLSEVDLIIPAGSTQKLTKNPIEQLSNAFVRMILLGEPGVVISKMQSHDITDSITLTVE